MSLRNSIADELKRTPVAAMSGAASAVIAALSLLLAWVQYRSASTQSGPPTAPNGVPPTELFLGNVFLALAYFLAVTVATALLIRSIARKHDLAALVGSIPLFALTNFSVILVIYLAPPRPLSPALFASAHDLVFYASAAIIVAFCGKAVVMDIGAVGGNKGAELENSSTGQKSDGLGILMIALLMLVMWSWLVFAGQTRLARTLLPEVAHPSEVKASKSVG
jgi:hypothetical protein